ncbi:MAG: short-chain dehydrogenase [Deltaproteobacteria bacterium]|nr:short-chain dehydrogenase [Deltaproteobacteria bacterium]
MSLALDLSERVAIVTGAGRGIGEGIARAMADAGARVVIADKDARAGQAAADEIAAAGGEVIAVATDVRDPEACQELVVQAQGTWQRVDILVNNAGGTRRSAFLDLGPEGWRRHTDLNLGGLFAPTDAAVHAMIAGGRGGAIVNVASIEGLRAAPFYSVYAACKAGMLNFTRSLALELAEHRIRVNAIAPDVIDTPAIRGALQEQPGALAALERAVPLGRLGSVEDCAAACVFLASDLASYLTGITLSVDGGTWAAGGWRRNEDGDWVLGE